MEVVVGQPAGQAVRVQIRWHYIDARVMGSSNVGSSDFVTIPENQVYQLGAESARKRLQEGFQIDSCPAEVLKILTSVEKVHDLDPSKIEIF